MVLSIRCTGTIKFSTARTGYLALLPVLGLFVGCSSGWKDTGAQGPWCAPATRSKVFSRSWATFNGPRDGEVGYSNASGVKKSGISLSRELDDYFSRCSFINQWPAGGTVGLVRQHDSPFDLCLVSIDPTVIVGVERQDLKVRSFHSPARKGHVFTSSAHLLGFIEVRTTLPYHSGARVIWFSPGVDYDLHQLDPGAGTGTFAVGEQAQFSIVVDGEQLTTLRK